MNRNSSGVGNRNSSGVGSRNSSGVWNRNNSASWCRANTLMKLLNLKEGIPSSIQRAAVLRISQS